MITYSYRYYGIYPVRYLLFADEPVNVPCVGAWDIVRCLQASDAVKERYLDMCLMARSMTTIWTDLALPLEDILARAHATTRNEIRRGERSQPEIRLNQYSPAELYQAHAAFCARKQLRLGSYHTYLSRLSMCDVVSAHLNGRLVVCHVYMRDLPSRVRLLYSFDGGDAICSDSLRGMVNRYLHWWSIGYYKGRKCMVYDWGGIDLRPDAPTAGIARFKQSFGGQVKQEWNMVIAGKAIRPVGGHMLATEERLKRLFPTR